MNFDLKNNVRLTADFRKYNDDNIVVTFRLEFVYKMNFRVKMTLIGHNDNFNLQECLISSFECRKINSDMYNKESNTYIEDLSKIIDIIKQSIDHEKLKKFVNELYSAQDILNEAREHYESIYKKYNIKKHNSYD